MIRLLLPVGYFFPEKRIAVFVNISMAFDRIERGSRIECMKKNICDPRMIEVFASVYENDSAEFQSTEQNIANFR